MRVEVLSIFFVTVVNQKLFDLRIYIFDKEGCVTLSDFFVETGTVLQGRGLASGAGIRLESYC